MWKRALARNVKSVISVRDVQTSLVRARKHGHVCIQELDAKTRYFARK